MVEEDKDDDYMVNTVVAFEEFGDSQEVLKLFEFKDKNRSSEQLKRNVVIKIQVSLNKGLEQHQIFSQQYIYNIHCIF